MSEWINVKDKVPQPNEEVLTYNGNYIYFESFDYTLGDDHIFSESGCGITHWMPLPKPPIKDERSLQEFLKDLNTMNTQNIEFLRGLDPKRFFKTKYIKELQEVQKLINSFDFSVALDD